MVWRGRFSIRDGRSAASSIQGYEPAGPILDYALKPQIMAPGYLPEAFAINDSCKADGRKRRGPEQLSFIHQGEIARALSYLLARIRRLEDGRIDGFVLIRLPGAVALAITAAVAKYFLA